MYEKYDGLQESYILSVFSWVYQQMCVNCIYNIDICICTGQQSHPGRQNNKEQQEAVLKLQLGAQGRLIYQAAW
jgi:hypothetical protein